MKFADAIIETDEVVCISRCEVIYKNGERQCISREATDALLKWFTPSEKR